MVKKLLGYALVCLACALAAVTLFLPDRFSYDNAEQCFYETEDGTIARISYAEAYRRIETVRGDGVVLTGGGFVDGSERLATVIETLSNGELAQLLAVQADGLTNLERAAIYRVWGNTLFYDGDSFAWNGAGVSRTDRVRATRVVLLGGSLPNGFLAQSGATEIVVGADAEIDATDLIGSAVSSLSARAPYYAEGNCLYLSRGGSVRLVAALPCEDIVLGYADYYDRGALSACGNAVSLTVPNLRGELCSLFSEQVPHSLKTVTVTGGRVDGVTFYGCPSVETITACKVETDGDAFLGCGSLKTLHTANKDVRLTGEFSRSRADCGCYIFTNMM